jgi:Kiwa protein KwaB-like
VIPAENASRTARSLIVLLGAGALELVVAFRHTPAEGILYDLFRVEMDDDLRNDVRGLPADTLATYADEPMPQDPGRPLQAGEWYVTTPTVAGMQEFIQALSHPLELPVLEVRELDRRTPAWYALVVVRDDRRWAAFIRRSSQFYVARRGKLIALFRERTLVRAPRDSRTLRFDEKFDLVLEANRLLVANTATLDALFTDREAMAAEVPRQVEQLRAAGLELANAAEFAQACQGNLYMMRKLSRIVGSGYIAQITPRRVSDLVREFGIQGRIMDGGRFFFDRDNRWVLLKVLDDDFLRSPLTATRYESSAKVRVQAGP